MSSAFGMCEASTHVRVWVGATREMKIGLIALALVAGCCAVTAPALAKEDLAQVEATELPTPLAPPDRSNPRATIQALQAGVTAASALLVDARNEFSLQSGWFMSEDVRARVEQSEAIFARSARTLDLSQVPPSSRGDVGLESAMMLKEILDRLPLPPMEEIPGADTPNLNEIERWRLPVSEIDLVRIKEGVDAGQWLFSSDSVERLPAYYEAIRHLPYRVKDTAGLYEYYISTPGELLPPKYLNWIERLPQSMRAVRFGQTIWQWAGLSLAAAIALAVPALAFVWTHRREPVFAERDRLRRSLPTPLLAMAMAALFEHVIQTHLNITGVLLNVSVILANIAFYAAAAWASYVAVAFVSESIVASPRIDPRSIDASVVRLIGATLGGCASITWIFVGADRIGVPLLPLLGGLGIGGIAVALAAKTTIENLLGGLLLYINRPVRIGDFCRFGEHSGTVESIGLQTTRVRKLDRTVVNVPNAEFANQPVVNFAPQERRLFRQTIALPADISHTELERILSEIRAAMARQPLMAQKSAYARFIGFSDVNLNGIADAAANIEVFGYVEVSSQPAFLEAQEKLLLEIVGIVQGAPDMPAAS